MTELGLVCLIALTEPVDLVPERVRAAIAQVAPRSAVGVEGRGSDALAITLDRHPLVATVLAETMPDEATEALGRSLFWPDAALALSRHAGFVALAAAEPARGLGLVRAQAVALTRAAAGLAEELPALGIYWHGAGAVVPPERLARAAAQFAQDRWPVDVWFGYRLHGTQLADGTYALGVRTQGAAAYLGHEIEVPPFPSTDRGACLRILWNAVGYLMAAGDVLRDGQLVEVSGERRTRYRLTLAPGGRPGVAQLEVVGGA